MSRHCRLSAINAGQRKKAPPLRLLQQTPQEPKQPGQKCRGRTPPRPHLQGRGSLRDPQGATQRPCFSERLCRGLRPLGSPHPTPHSVQSSPLMPPKKHASHTAQVRGADGEPCPHGEAQVRPPPPTPGPGAPFSPVPGPPQHKGRPSAVHLHRFEQGTSSHPSGQNYQPNRK